MHPSSREPASLSYAAGEGAMPLRRIATFLTSALTALPAVAQSEVETMTQVNREAILAIKIPGDRPEFTLFYDVTRAPPTQIKAAPVYMCGSIDMRPAEVQDLPPEDPAKTPDVRRLVVRCR